MSIAPRPVAVAAGVVATTERPVERTRRRADVRSRTDGFLPGAAAGPARTGPWSARPGAGFGRAAAVFGTQRTARA
jgi:hypothetical protein